MTWFTFTLPCFILLFPLSFPVPQAGKQIHVPWASFESEAVRSYFQEQIRNMAPIGLADAQRCVNANKISLRKRDKKAVKTYYFNYLKKLRKLLAQGQALEEEKIAPAPRQRRKRKRNWMLAVWGCIIMIISCMLPYFSEEIFLVS